MEGAQRAPAWWDNIGNSFVSPPQFPHGHASSAHDDIRHSHMTGDTSASCLREIRRRGRSTSAPLELFLPFSCCQATEIKWVLRNSATNTLKEWLFPPLKVYTCLNKLTCLEMAIKPEKVWINDYSETTVWCTQCCVSLSVPQEEGVKQVGYGL